MALAADLALALDPVQLARQAGIEADAWQAEALRSTAPRELWNVTRQGGKSSVAGVLAIHVAVYDPDPAPILLLSPSLRQSQELFRKTLDAYRVVEGSEPPEAESALRLELGNGSRIISLPGKEATIRGYSGVRLLIIDEAARVPDALYYAVRPMLAVSGGRLLCLSTPFGKRGFFFHEWEEGGDAWHRVEIHADQCPRIPPAFLEEERRGLPAWVYRQEYECSFEEDQQAVFLYDDIAAAINPDLVPLELWP
jgi:hypothetical protein